MVVGKIIIPIGFLAVLVIGAVFLFNKFNVGKGITDFFGNIQTGFQKFGEDIAKGFGDVSEQISQGVGDVGQQVQDSIEDAGGAIFDAGVESRKFVDEKVDETLQFFGPIQQSIDETILGIGDSFQSFFFPQTENSLSKQELDTINKSEFQPDQQNFIGNDVTIFDLLEAKSQAPIEKIDTVEKQTRGEKRFGK